MTSPGLLREARALVFALVVLSVSVALHSWAHGGLPPVTAVLAGAGLVLGAGVLLAGRRRGLPVIAGTLAATQAGLHGLFTVLTPDDRHMLMMPAHSPSAMLGAHLAAGALAAGWLCAGEVATWRLVRWLTQRIPVLGAVFALLTTIVLAPAPRVTWARIAARRVPLPRPMLSRSVVRRGPPPALTGIA